jgi:4-hydroxy-2-oxoheptanedioate aldolase
VQSTAEVKRAIAGFQIPPAGSRGWDPTVAADNYGSSNGTWSRSRAPRCYIQVETRSALNRAHEIARVPGVTDLFVGPADLSRALGSSGEVYTPQVKAAMEKLPARTRSAGVGLGAFVDSPERAAWAYRHGYRFLAVVPDVVLLARAATAATEPIARLGLD